MKHRRSPSLPALPALLALAGAGCTTDGAEQALETARRALITSPACETGQVIARQKGSRGACDRGFQGTDGVWRGRPLLERPGAGDVYCGYQWIPRVGDARPDFLALAPLDRLADAVEEDCPVLRPAAISATPAAPVPVEHAVVDLLRSTFHKQAGRVPGPAWKAAPVTVAVIDSAAHAFSDPAHDNYGHGRAMGRIIADLACVDEATCASRIHNQLALPHLTPSRLDLAHGGFFGTRGQLGEAITRAVDGWLPNAAKGGRLVLNLSLGWDPADDAKFPSKLTNDVVRDALTRAACLDVLAIAAAGNANGFSKGPAYPGAWETLPSPGPEECALHGIESASPTIKLFPSKTSSLRAVGVLAPKRYAPLLYAAAAVDAVDEPLATTRPLGRPALAAYGDRVITDDPIRPPYHTLILSGTSVAAAVASGAAVALWNLSPGLGRHQVMEIVYASAEPLLDRSTAAPALADFCLGGAPCGGRTVRRVSVCAAVRAVAPGVPCDIVPAHAGSPLPPPPTPPPVLPLDATVSDSGVPGTLSPPSTEMAPGEWVLPQPNWPHCKNCRVTSDGILWGELDPFQSPVAGSVVTHIFASFGGNPWQQIEPAGIAWYEPAFGRYLGPGAWAPGWIVFNVMYVEFGIWVRSYQTPPQPFDWVP